MTRVVSAAAASAGPSPSPLNKHDHYYAHCGDNGGDDDDYQYHGHRHPQTAPVLAACTMTRYSAHDLHVLRTLPASKPIVVFTPAILAGLPVPTKPESSSKVAAAGAGAAGATTPGHTGLLDPFEFFGRALHHYHRSIRQMPFLPQRRFTDVHEWLLQRAGAVVVVVSATPPGPSGAASASPPANTAAAHRQCLDAQVDFALSAHEMLADPACFPDARARPPLVLFQCGDIPRDCWPDGFHAANVVTCGAAYEPRLAREMSSTLFSRPL